MASGRMATIGERGESNIFREMERLVPAMKTNLPLQPTVRAPMIRQLNIFFLVALYAGVALPQTEPTYVLKHGWMQCDDERDVIDIADASSTGTEWFKTIWEKVVKGACTGGMKFPQRVTSVMEKRTPADHTYYCFNLLEQGELSPSGDGHIFQVAIGEHLCAPANMVTTVDAELAARTGDFDVVADYDVFVSATCREGGLVKVRKNDDGAWFRTSLGFPWKRPYFIEDVPAGQDRSKAIRDGCKGADVQ